MAATSQAVHSARSNYRHLNSTVARSQVPRSSIVTFVEQFSTSAASRAHACFAVIYAALYFGGARSAITYSPIPH